MEKIWVLQGFCQDFDSKDHSCKAQIWRGRIGHYGFNDDLRVPENIYLTDAQVFEILESLEESHRFSLNAGSMTQAPGEAVDRSAF